MVNRQYLPLRLRNMSEPKPFVITIVGAESSGKTTLAMALAEHFQSPWIPEYAREYLMALDRPYNSEDLEVIAVRQLEIIHNFVRREASVVSDFVGRTSPNPLMGVLYDDNQSKIQNPKSKILIVDGGMLNLKMWSRIKYGKTIPIVDEALKKDVTDLYLLCRPHKEWIADSLREAPSLLERVWIYNQYLEELVRQEKPFEIIHGEENNIEKIAMNLFRNHIQSDI